MAWKDVKPMEERKRFVGMAHRKDQTFSELCHAFGVSRKTGYKWWGRYQEGGLDAMVERSHRPLCCPHQTAPKVVKLLLKERVAHPTWGAKKLRKLLLRNYALRKLPSVTALANTLRRHGLSRQRKRRTMPGVVIARDHLTKARYSNHVWTVDFKGKFKTRDGKYCEPLTVSDLFSRYLLGCEAIKKPTCESVCLYFTKLFKETGLPELIRVDSGTPFGATGACGLSRVSAWWISLGIRVEFLQPGHPEENGSHERMHRTLKADTACPPAQHRKAQQKRFDRWRKEFNEERPHEALRMKCPVEKYKPSKRRYEKKPRDAGYPSYYEVRRVRKGGMITRRGERHIGEAFRGMKVGLKPVGEDEYQVYFYEMLLGYLRTNRPGGIQPLMYEKSKRAAKKEAATKKKKK